MNILIYKSLKLLVFGNLTTIVMLKICVPFSNTYNGRRVQTINFTLLMLTEESIQRYACYVVLCRVVLCRVVLFRVKS